jgi:SAM-dependent methyltransferase
LSTAAYIFATFACVVALVLAAWLGLSRRSVPCHVWLGWLVELDSPFTRTNRAKVIIDRSDIRPGMAVLDVGCGPGRLTVPLARRVGEHGLVVAVDVQAGMLDRAREKARAANLTNVRFVHAPAGAADLDHDAFDRALLVTVLGEIPDRNAALKEIFSALRPGGLLSVTEVIFDPHFQSRSGVARRAGAVGFREQARHGGRLAFTLIVRKPGPRDGTSSAATPAGSAPPPPR